MNNNQKIRIKNTKDFSGAPLKLTLDLKQKFEDRKYDLYYVSKVVEKDGEREIIPLYAETFTPEQVEEFYTKRIFDEFGMPIYD